VQQFVQNSIEEDKGGAHFEEAQGLGSLFHEICGALFCMVGERSSVRVEVGCQTQPKGFIEGVEGLLLVLGTGAIEYAFEHVGHCTFRNPYEVDCFEFECLGQEVHVLRNPILRTPKVVAASVDLGFLNRRQGPSLEILHVVRIHI